MKLFASFAVLSVGVLLQITPVLLPAQSRSVAPIVGIWQGTATARGGQQIPVTLKVTASGHALKAALLNGPASHPEELPASSVSFDGKHLVASYDYFARKLDATLDGGSLKGTYGPATVTGKGTPTPFTLTRVAKATDPPVVAGAPDIHGSWEIATTNSKGVPYTWEFRVDPSIPGSSVIKAVIQRIDGDTGGLWGTWNGTSYTVGHFTPAGTALYAVTPHSDGTLTLKNLIPPLPTAVVPGARATATAPVKPLPSEYIAHRPEEARKQNIADPSDPTHETWVKDPSVPFAFSFPDLTGKTVSNTDSQFAGKVVIVAIGGSWCPNCHDEAPFLVSLYKQFHARGLEIVDLDFEQGDPDTDTARLKAFIAHYNIPYIVLTAGNTDQLNEKIPQGVNLNFWPTSFFLDRTGRVQLVHAGFAGPGNTAGHEELERDVTALVEKLLAQTPPVQSASR